MCQVTNGLGLVSRGDKMRPRVSNSANLVSRYIEYTSSRI